MAKLDFDGLSYFWSKAKTYISNLLKGKADLGLVNKIVREKLNKYQGRLLLKIKEE